MIESTTTTLAARLLTIPNQGHTRRSSIFMNNGTMPSRYTTLRLTIGSWIDMMDLRSGTTVIDNITTYRGTMTLRVTSERFGCSRLTISNEWLCLERGIIRWIIEGVNFRYITILEGWLSDAWREEWKNTDVVCQRRRQPAATINKEETSTKKTSTLSYQHILFFFQFYSLTLHGSQPSSAPKLLVKIYI